MERAAPRSYFRHGPILLALGLRPPSVPHEGPAGGPQILWAAPELDDPPAPRPLAALGAGAERQPAQWRAKMATIAMEAHPGREMALAYKLEGGAGPLFRRGDGAEGERVERTCHVLAEASQGGRRSV